MVQRNRIGNTAVVIVTVPYFYRTAETRQGAACHNSTVVVTDNVVFGKISCPPGCGIGCRHIKFSRIFHDGRVIKRICPIGICQCPVNILQAK